MIMHDYAWLCNMHGYTNASMVILVTRKYEINLNQFSEKTSPCTWEIPQESGLHFQISVELVHCAFTFFLSCWTFTFFLFCLTFNLLFLWSKYHFLFHPIVFILHYECIEIVNFSGASSATFERERWPQERTSPVDCSSERAIGRCY